MVKFKPTQKVIYVDPGDETKYYGVVIDVYYNKNEPESLRVDIMWGTNVDVATYYYGSRMLDDIRPVYNLPRGNPNREFKEENANEGEV